MNHIYKSAVAGAAVLSLASCAGLQLQKAEKMEPMGSAFDNALAKDYLVLSQSEYREGDYRDSDTFAIASMSSGAGDAVLPEELGSRMLPEDSVGELSAARNRLMAALDAGGREIVPDEMAMAQTCFDGWMQEQEENFQPDDIAARRDCFMDAMAKVEAALAGGPRGAFLVFFDWNKANLTPEALEIVQNVTATAKEMSVSQVDLVGHTDTSGSASYNLGLSKRRAGSVKNAMVGMGVPAGIITATGVGQADPLVPTGDNVREPQNRRVEINLVK